MFGKIGPILNDHQAELDLVFSVVVGVFVSRLVLDEIRHAEERQAEHEIELAEVRHHAVVERNERLVVAHVKRLEVIEQVVERRDVRVLVYVEARLIVEETILGRF